MKFWNNSFLKTGLIAVAVATVAAACSKSEFDINNTPNSATDSTISYDVVLPAALNNSATVVTNSWGFLQNWMGYWARSGQYAPNLTEETYNITTGFGTGIWNGLYNANFDLDVMQTKAKAENALFYQGIARIMKAHNFIILVDVYNNIPYKEALKGGGNTTPRYDNGLDVYKDLFRQIDTGIAQIKQAVISENRDITTNDIMFKGNKVLWAKFGNTLKLRMLIHTSAISGINVNDEVARIVTEGSGYLGSGQNAQVNPGFRADRPNPFYNVFYRDVANQQTANFQYYKANAYATNYYFARQDPRGQRFYSLVQGSLVGVPYGAPPSAQYGPGRVSDIGPGVARADTQSSWVVTAAESFFLQAEAAQRGFITGDPKTLLNAGINESFTYLGATGSASSYIAANANFSDVNYDAGTTTDQKLFTIISQKWFALNTFAPFEVWTDYRRTDFRYGVQPPGSNIFTPGPPISIAQSNTSTKIPTRLLYPQSEYNFNPANVGTQGDVNRYSRIFWDIN